MSTPGFDIEVRSSGAAVTLILTGELDIATSGRLRDVLRMHEDRGQFVTVDLSRLDFIDAAGLGVVLEAFARAKQDGFDLRVTAGTGVARRLIELVGRPLPLD